MTVIAVSCVLSMQSALAQTSDEQDLAAAAQNPVADLVSLPFQNNTLFGIGPNDETVNVLNIQPVAPFGLTDDWNIITRTIIPLIYIENAVAGLDVLPEGIGDDVTYGLGDINFTAFVSPSAPNKLIWGVGPSISLPTATDEVLGSEKWSAGPSVVALLTPKPWVIGALARQLWSVAGDDNRNDVSQFLIQPFVNYNMAKGWYAVSAPVITANWNADSDDRWTVPVGAGFGRIFPIGKQPVNASAHTYYNVESPTLGPDWTLRLQMQLLFPK